VIAQLSLASHGREQIAPSAHASQQSLRFINQSPLSTHSHHRFKGAAAQSGAFKIVAGLDGPAITVQI
jgi:hypothetical protein